MSTLEILSASAGSGKTHALTRRLQKALRTGAAAPDGILATTFTVKAAAELRQRARSALLAQGRSADAQRLGASRIGTVHSVCARLLTEFAFEARVPPELRVLGEAQTGRLLRRAVDEVMTRSERDTLQQIRSRFDRTFDPEARIGELMEQARANGLDAEALVDCGEAAGRECLELLGRPSGDADSLDGALRDAVEAFLDRVDLESDTTRKTRDAVESVEKVHQRLRSGQEIPWADWVRMAKLEVSKRADDNQALKDTVVDAGLAHDVHPRLHRDLETLVPLLFGIASRALERYQELKAQRGLIDFVDQEARTLELLGHPAVRERLGEELDLVLVDEFQDTSPIQLALFLKFSSLADRSVWVGDQKQAIFGFRGTDPALMDAAIDHFLDEDADTLDWSWRSVPALVELTSELFAPAFDAVGIPAERVRLEPQPEDPRPDLRPCLEHWDLAAAKKEERNTGLAACLERLLEDPEVRVQDPRDGTLRQVTAGDVAVLCRLNRTTLSVAEALRQRGIDSALQRDGLLATLEGRVATAGLALWIDPDDSLAAAILSRLLDHPEDPEGWLREALESPRAASFLENDRIRRLREIRTRRPDAGPGLLLESILEALELRSLCRRWGDSTRRLANLDALVGHANTFADEARGRGEAPTATGLLHHLRTLAEDDLDAQAVPGGEDAVTLTTWHRAKGREWPVTVLYELDYQRDPSGFGVHVRGTREGFDPRNPLADRRLSYRPNPFHRNHTGMPFHERLEDTPSHREAVRSHHREQLRLLYVGWTRARDRLVLACRSRDFTDGLLGHLRDDDGPLLSPPRDGEARWAGQEVPVVIRRPPAEAPEPRPRAPSPGPAYVTRGPRDHPPARQAPSAVEGTGTVVAEERLGERLPLRGRPDEPALGELLHRLFAADVPGLSENERSDLARRLLTRWDLAEHLEPGALLSASDRLRTWIEDRWPGARPARELPLHHRLPADTGLQGTVVRGTADLVLALPDRLALVDHKAFPGPRDRARERAATHAGQLETYRQALEAARGIPVTETWIHFPVSGLVVRIGDRSVRSRGEPR